MIRRYLLTLCLFIFPFFSCQAYQGGDSYDYYPQIESYCPYDMTVTLNNGLVLEIEPGFYFTYLVEEPLAVLSSNNYSLTLLNPFSGNSFSATICPCKCKESRSFSVTHIYSDKLYLSDGSLWFLPPAYSHLAQTWYIGDTIFIMPTLNEGMYQMININCIESGSGIVPVERAPQ